ncbi:hypothetical protein F5B22DRAFT_637244 [Xylaria bambusicola]|uniref:uncharacterized protein n=1 Tax=Xylaria bambusicola TaxID=326684 RepID=UPI00200895CD|nr:uncharacterized protein F5B22DRAFT_637244 [Xylaria bambusicola]KAI0513309.1 hypothetical protein F5B22DRAFT_637244 [Xylaria bambusicola]
MNEAIVIRQNLEDGACDLNLPFFGAPPESDRSPTLEFPWTHPAEDVRYSRRRNLRKPTREIWVTSTNVRPYGSTNDEFNSEFELDSDPAEPALSTQGRTIGQLVYEINQLNTADFISAQQDFSAENFLNGNETCNATSSKPSLASTRLGRRPTSTSTSASSTTPMDAIGVPDIKQRRERNRVAARKCRQKAKQNIVGLQRRERDLSQQNTVLLSHVGNLREEILDLKNEILRHSECNSSVIQNYIANAARRQMG